MESETNESPGEPVFGDMWREGLISQSGQFLYLEKNSFLLK